MLKKKARSLNQINCAVFWHMDCVFTLEWNETPQCWIDTIELIWLKCKTTEWRGIVGIVCLQWASLAQKVCLPDGVTDLNVYLLSFFQRYVMPGCLLTRYILILSHMLLFQCDVPLQSVPIWLIGFFVFVVNCKVTLGSWRQSIHPSSLAFARHPPRFTAKRGQFNVAQGAIKGVWGGHRRFYDPHHCLQ